MDTFIDVLLRAPAVARIDSNSTGRPVNTRLQLKPRVAIAQLGSFHDGTQNIFDVQSDGGIECTAQLSASVRHTIEPRWGVWLVYHLSGSRGSQGVVSVSASRAYARRKNVMTGCRRTIDMPAFLS